MKIVSVKIKQTFFYYSKIYIVPENWEKQKFWWKLSHVFYAIKFKTKKTKKFIIRTNICITLDLKKTKKRK